MRYVQFKEEIKRIDEYFSNTPQEEIEKKLEKISKENYNEDFEKDFFSPDLYGEE